MVQHISPGQADIRAKKHAGHLREQGGRKGGMEVKINGLNHVPDALCSLFYLTLTACEVGIALSIYRLGPRHSERNDHL